MTNPFHIYKWGEIKDGYQYCVVCGKAIFVPCNHKWGTIEEYLIRNSLGDKTIGEVYIQQCEHCKTITKTTIRI